MAEYVCSGCEKPINSLNEGVHVVGQNLYFHTPGLVAGKDTMVTFRTGGISNSSLKACYQAYVAKQWRAGSAVAIQFQFEPIKELDDIAHQ